MKSSLTVVRWFTAQILELEKVILGQVKLRPEFKKLVTVNGIGPILGLTLMLETGDFGRFESAGHYASYCRCVNSLNAH